MRKLSSVLVVLAMVFPSGYAQACPDCAPKVKQPVVRLPRETIVVPRYVQPPPKVVRPVVRLPQPVVYAAPRVQYVPAIAPRLTYAVPAPTYAYRYAPAAAYRSMYAAAPCVCPEPQPACVCPEPVTPQPMPQPTPAPVDPTPGPNDGFEAQPTPAQPMSYYQPQARYAAYGSQYYSGYYASSYASNYAAPALQYSTTLETTAAAPVVTETAGVFRRLLGAPKRLLQSRRGGSEVCAVAVDPCAVAF